MESALIRRERAVSSISNQENDLTTEQASGSKTNKKIQFSLGYETPPYCYNDIIVGK